MVRRLILLVWPLILAQAVHAQTAGMVSFQGRLKQNGTPVNGSVNLKFEVFDAATVGLSKAGPFCAPSVISTNGLVSTKFGPILPSAFDGSPRWLEVSICTNGQCQSCSPLPRLDMATAPATAEQLNRPGTGIGEVFVNATTGFVGIGTMTPGAKLDVAGTVSVGKPTIPGSLSLFNGQSPNQETITLDGKGESGGGEVTVFNNAGRRTIAAASDVGNGSPEVHLFNGQSPSSTVEIDGDGGGYGGGALVLRTSDSPQVRSVQLNANAPGGSPQLGFLRLTTNDDRRIDMTGGDPNPAGAGPAISVLSSSGVGVNIHSGSTGEGGNIKITDGQPTNNTIILTGATGVGYFQKVGIGTDNPQESLHIAGTPGVDGIKFPDGTVQTTAASSAAVKPKIELTDQVAPIVVQTSWTSIIGVTITVPAPGKILIVGNSLITTDNGGGEVEHGISTTVNSPPVNNMAPEGHHTIVSQHRAVAETAGSYTYYLVARKTAGDCTLRTRQLSATYVPD